MTSPAYQSIAVPPLDPKDPFFGASLRDPAVRADPHARLRAVSPVRELPFGVFRLARYSDCRRLLRDVPTAWGASLFRVLGRVPLRLSA